MQLVTIVLDALSGAAIMLIAASGLALIFGLMNVINLAHAGLLAIGAYCALKLQAAGLAAWLALPAAVVVTGVIGVTVERVVIRRLYLRPLDTILATWGLTIIATQALTIGFGRAPQPFEAPITGPVDLGFVEYSGYRLLLIGVAAALLVTLIVVSTRTTLGLKARAVMADPSLAEGLGLNTEAVRLWTFGIGCGLAGFAGALLGPLATISPNFGFNLLVPAFLVVLLAGRSLVGLGAAAVVLAGAQSLFGRYVDTAFALAFVVVLAVVLLRALPDGFVRLRRWA